MLLQCGLTKTQDYTMLWIW